MPHPLPGVNGFFNRTRLLTLLISVAGGLTFLWLHGPLPFLLGPLLFLLIAALCGAQLRDLGLISTYMRTFLGIAVGTSITPQTITQLPSMASTLIIIPFFIVVIGAAGYYLFRFVFKFDAATAWYAAMPGGLQDMLLFGEEAGGNPRALSLIHATRVLIIVTLTPYVLSRIWEIDLGRLPGQPASETDFVQLLLMFLTGWVGWKVAARVGLFGASILGPLILSMLLSLAGILTTRPPTELIVCAQLFIAMTIGSRYSGITLVEIRTSVLAGLTFSAVLALISAALILGIQLLDLAPALETSLAFLPGGQAEMVVLAIIAHADLSFVVCHHLVRLVTVILCAPLMARLLLPDEPD